LRITVLTMEGKRAGQLLISRTASVWKNYAHDTEAGSFRHSANKWLLPPG
jgi:hypothetical protein